MFVSFVARYRDELPVWSHRAAERDELSMSGQHLLGKREHRVHQGFTVCLWVTHRLFLSRRRRKEQRYPSSAPIISTRVACRPPSNWAVRNASTISSASPSPTTRAPIDSMLASLCWRIMRAENVSTQTPQRIPLTLFAAIMMPWPVPHRMMPNRQSPEATSRAAASPCLG